MEHNEQQRADINDDDECWMSTTGVSDNLYERKVACALSGSENLHPLQSGLDLY